MKKFMRMFAEGIAMIWKVLLGAVIVGIITGFLGASFYRIVDWSTENFTHHVWLVWLLPAAGALIAFLYRLGGDVGETNRVLKAVRGEAVLSALMVPLIYAGTVLTRLFGGSVGTEGAAIQIGAGSAGIVGRYGRLKPEQKRVLLMSGIAGGFASIVGTPVTAIVLAIELAGVGVMYYSAILPCAVSSAVSFAIAGAFGSSFPNFHMGGIPALDARSILQVVALAAMAGLVSILLCTAIRCTGKGFARIFPNTVLRAVIGGLIIALLTALLGTTAYNEGGLTLLAQAEKGQAAPESFLWKIAFTALTIGAGFKGGAIVPTLVTGAAFGSAVSPVLGLSPSLSAGIGMTAVFCGAINCPMTSFVLGLEVFGADAALFFLLACAVSYVCSGSAALYPAQKIWQRKIGHPRTPVPYKESWDEDET